MSNSALINKYRPQSFSEVMGHDEILAALEKAIQSDACPHGFLFTGPAGTGKTTTARIVANELECDEVIEIDAASNNGIDDMRALVELGNHRALSGAGRRAFIIDEAHGLSKPAWQAMLKMLEEPPNHLYIMLCTTELAKVPETILTRCYHVALRAVKPNVIEELLTVISEIEGWTVTNDVMAAIIQVSTGQPRKALSILQVVHDAETREEVNRIIALMDASEPLIELCQLLLKGQTAWELVQPLLAKLDEDDFENGLMGAGRYIATVLMRTSNQAAAERAWILIDAMTFPTTTYDKKVHFLSAIGRICFGAS